MTGRLKKTIAIVAAISTLVVMNGTSVVFADAVSTSSSSSSSGSNSSSSSSSSLSTGSTSSSTSTGTQVVSGAKANTPIQHVVLIFDENESFDHYFGTYPIAKNPAGEPLFYAAPGTPSVNGLTAGLLTNNPNKANPQRLDRSQAETPDMDHGYTSEAKSFDGGLMDKFVENDGHGNSMVMDYYDGNTVTGFWNFAQHFAMSDNSFGSNLGPSTPGAINVISGDDSGATAYNGNAANGGTVLKPGDKGFPSNAISDTGTLYGDIDPYYDYASKNSTASLKGTNIGDLLNAKNLTWGCFFGGYDDPTAAHTNIGGQSITDYIPHHEPFQYYNDTSDTDHKKPTSVAMIGHTDQADHQYDLNDFWAAANAGNLPNYAFLKAPAYEDGHPSYSDPLDEQNWLAETVNRLEKLPSWSSTAIIIAYDDSDGWYDHVMPPIVNQSNDSKTDGLEGNNSGTKTPMNGQEDRLGYGPRLPFLIISPYAKHNYVSNTVTDQSSILRFVEDNWNLGRIGNGSFDTEAGSIDDMFDFDPGYYNPPLFLDRNTGEPVATQIAPFEQQGYLYMGIKDLEQSLDVQPYTYEDEESFMYGSNFVEISLKDNTIKVNGKTVDLGASIINSNGVICIPIDNLAKSLGVTPVKYNFGEILFKPIDKINSDANMIDSATSAGAPTSKAGVELTLTDNDTTGADALKITSPTSVVSPATVGKIVNQTINGIKSKKTYNFTISATDANGNAADANATVYLAFMAGGTDVKGTVTYDGNSITGTKVPIKLDANGKAVITYTVDAAPTNYDAYENDEIMVSDSSTTSASTYTNQIIILD
ncbi:phospholipase C [Clostridium hydrogenum]|uniref:phospholipase C n=1 Tax=Clostridium hydrogenum TaxID=2855764 RepID=UPI001F3D258E|nr:alkaline phosphatase family protein [Clostridium hydrogenum]